MIYKVEVTEVLSRVVEIEAVNSDEAAEIVSDMYHGEDIVLDYNDIQVTEFNIV